MTPMLNCYPERRKLSDEMLNHPWLTSPTPNNYFMYPPCDIGLKMSTRRSRLSGTTWRRMRRVTRSTNTSRTTKTETMRTTTGEVRMSLMSSSGTRNEGTSAISTAASWTWGTSGTGMGFTWISWTSGPTGSSRPDHHPYAPLSPHHNLPRLLDHSLAIIETDLKRGP